ncbi:hypothetical protein Pelo_9008 [Pelomyxa schiedti]|nr:hypothetical protein Pelo_9008 [Pelomyxa schiedti]
MEGATEFDDDAARLEAKTGAQRWFKSHKGPRVGPDEWFRAAFAGDTDTLRSLLARDHYLLNSVSDELQRVV